MKKSKIDIIYDMVNLAYDVKRQWLKDKDSYWLGDLARAVIKAKDEKVYDKFVDLADQLKTEGWEEFISACEYLIDEYNQIDESKKSMKESEENFVNYIAVYDEDGDCCGYVQNESPKLTQDLEKALHFKNENEANNFISKLLKRGTFSNDDLYVEGIYLNESKKSAKTFEESDDNWYKLKMLNEMLDAMVKDEYNIPKLGIYGVTKNIDLDEGAIRALIKYYK